MNAQPWFTALAPAKVNLFLEVLARRADGYHELETLMLALDLADGVRVRRADRSGVSCSVVGTQASADIPLDGRNLAVRAAVAALELASAAGVDTSARGVELEIDKRIPSQAGLGGASSDAAAAFSAVERALAWNCPEDAARAALAALGSDCVFFRAAATTGFARCTGRGEIVEPLRAPSEVNSVLLLTPDVGAPTPLVYRSLGDPLCWRDERRSLTPRFTFATSHDEAEAESGAPALRWTPFNRLEEAACSALPRLSAWREFLRRQASARFCLSGSGSTFFAVFDAPAEADRALQQLLDDCRRAGLTPRGAWVARPFRPTGA